MRSWGRRPDTGTDVCGGTNFPDCTSKCHGAGTAARAADLCANAKMRLCSAVELERGIVSDATDAAACEAVELGLSTTQSECEAVFTSSTADADDTKACTYEGDKQTFEGLNNIVVGNAFESCKVPETPLSRKDSSSNA